MAKQNIDDGTWFDTSKARVFEEGTYWNGSNHISKATSSQYEHEKLYLTKKGTYIIHHWSQWQGSGESWRRVNAAQAAEWLRRNDYHDEAEELFPEESRAAEV